MLEARNVSLELGGNTIIDEVDIKLAPGQLVALVGPNGAGKSTLLRLLCGDAAPSNGSVTLDDVDLSKIDARSLAARRAVVPQAASMPFPFTVLEVVMLGASVPGFGFDETDAAHVALAALKRVGLTGFEGRFYQKLSGGERQRVHVARAFCQLDVAARATTEPQILLLDEPLSSQDLAYQRRLANEFRRQASDGRAVLMVVHDLNVAAAVADVIIVLHRGRVAANGAPAEALSAELLSDVYGCELAIVQLTAKAAPLVLFKGAHWEEGAISD